MSLVVLNLLGPATQGLVNGQLHGSGDGVGIHDDLAVYVSCCTARRLRQTAVVAQESLLVSIEDGHERYLGQVEALAQQVHTHQYVVDTLSQVGEDFHAVEGRYITVDIGCGDMMVKQIAAEFLGHALGQGGHEYTFAPMTAGEDLVHQIVDLVFALAHLDLWV